jgi:hypothetical protein
VSVPPSVTPPSPDEWPDTTRSLTGISKGAITTVTCPDHGFITDDESVTSVMFLQVLGMIQINGMNAVVQEVVDDDTFTVNINSTNFYTYSSGGIIVIDSGTPPIETSGSQTFNTPFQNTA